jgi:preprotein translocase subunit SecB
MQPSPLQLLQCSFESVNVTSVPEFDNTDRDPSFLMNPSGMTLSSETAVQNLDVNAEFSDYAIRFVLAFEPKEINAIPYRGELVLQAQVRMHGANSALERKQLAVVNGVSLVYGIARDMVCAITGRGVHGQMLLPTLNFRSLADSVQADDVAAQPPVVGSEPAAPKRKPASKVSAKSTPPKKPAKT